MSLQSNSQKLKRLAIRNSKDTSESNFVWISFDFKKEQNHQAHREQSVQLKFEIGQLWSNARPTQCTDEAFRTWKISRISLANKNSIIHIAWFRPIKQTIETMKRWSLLLFFSLSIHNYLFAAASELPESLCPTGIEAACWSGVELLLVSSEDKSMAMICFDERS